MSDQLAKYIPYFQNDRTVGVWTGGHITWTSPGVQGAGHSPPNHTAHIEPNTIIHSGQCQPHSLHSVEPATGVHAQHRESNWNRAKRSLRGCRLPSYLDEYLCGGSCIELLHPQLLRIYFHQWWCSRTVSCVTVLQVVLQLCTQHNPSNITSSLHSLF